MQAPSLWYWALVYDSLENTFPWREKSNKKNQEFHISFLQRVWIGIFCFYSRLCWTRSGWTDRLKQKDKSLINVCQETAFCLWRDSSCLSRTWTCWTVFIFWLTIASLSVWLSVSSLTVNCKQLFEPRATLSCGGWTTNLFTRTKVWITDTCIIVRFWKT